VASCSEGGSFDTREARPDRPGLHAERARSSYQADDEEECFRTPIRRFDPYSGHVVVVGTKLARR